jgi:DNA-binding CsgD family transcriptional regulator
MKLDAIGVVEACYAPAADEASWLLGVLRALEPLDGGLGLYATRFDASAPDRVRFDPETVMLHADERWAEAARRATLEGDPAVIDALYRGGRPVSLASERLRHLVTPAATSQGPLAHGQDVLGISAQDADRRGVLIGIPIRSDRAPGPQLRHALTSIAAHVTAARRLRSITPQAADPEGAEAVLAPGGSVVHACGPATAATARETLGRAVRAVERARAAARRVEPGDALALWRALVAGTWSLVDSVDSDGKRFVLARRNTPGVREPRALTPRERDVLAYAALGHANKYVAYLLGLRPSTVAAHLASGQRKLGLRSRAELIRMFACRG